MNITIHKQESYVWRLISILLLSLVLFSYYIMYCFIHNLYIQLKYEHDKVKEEIQTLINMNHSLSSETKMLLMDYNDSIKSIREIQQLIKPTNFKSSLIKSKVTSYHPPSGGINSWGDGTETYNGSKPIPYYTCAITMDMIKQGLLGKFIYVEDNGIYLANDKLNNKYRGYHVDLVSNTLQEAKDFGVKHLNIKVLK